MWRIFSQYSLFFIISLVLHVLVVGGLLLSYSDAPPVQKKAGVKRNVIQAVAVDASKIQSELEKLRRAEANKERKQKQRVQRQKDEARAVEKKRKSEQKKLADLKKQQKTEARKLKQQKLAQQKAIQQLKKKQKLEKEKVEKLKKSAAEARKKKQAAEKKLAQQKAQQKAEAEKKRKAQKELQERMAAEERAETERELSGIKLKYVDRIAAVVRGNWRRPAKLAKKVSCKVYVKQIPGGEIISYRVSACSGDSFFKRSVETALGKTRHLPSPPDPRVFDREINFTFIGE